MVIAPARVFIARGAAHELMNSREPEVLLEGPAGGGKTHALCQKSHFLAMNIPGMRILWVRKTRASLTQSVLVEFEASVLPKGHPAKSGTAKIDNRDTYQYPNGSVIVLAGLDNPDRFLSAQYDLICVFEAHECTLDDWQVLISRSRNGRFTPAGQMVADTNPRERGHWLNKRAKAGHMQRLLSKHWHNPRYYMNGEWTPLGLAYLKRLGTLSGARRAWMLEGRWDTAEGPVFPEYQPNIHIISPREVPGWHEEEELCQPLDWYFGAVDWGMTNPGVFQVWGVSADRALYRVKEVYRTNQQLDWWAERALEYHKKYDLAAIVCDPSRNDCIATFNERLGYCRTSIRGDPELLAFGANNKKASTGQDMGGLDAVRHYMHDEVSGRNNLFLVRDALDYGPDRDRKYAEKPVCTEDELESYVNQKNEEGKPIYDMPAKGSEDHGIDSMRYACTFHLTHNLGPDVKPQTWEPGAMGFIARHDEVGFNGD